MNLFKDLKMNWWQIAIFKSSVVAFGIIVGLAFPEFWQGLLPLLWAVLILGGAYILYIWYKQ